VIFDKVRYKSKGASKGVNTMQGKDICENCAILAINDQLLSIITKRGKHIIDHNVIIVLDVQKKASRDGPKRDTRKNQNATVVDSLVVILNNLTCSILTEI